MFTNKTLYSHSTPLYLEMGTGQADEVLGGGGGGGGGNPAMDQHPLQGEKKYSKWLHAAHTESS